MRGKRIEADWQGIRDSVVAGMTYREVSKQFTFQVHASEKELQERNGQHLRL
jgi:hypothetical protein